ncbi:hypothetical protein EB796_005742 [Bugula neritina]|uniref:Uncharacterized protein n=1 Tax=Bugula neritina TaxID=10212 RepID=A0A7J7KDL2_BUGNE|nr:hypothetical protein EB796_005742 [Bugula neritina]
MSRLSSALSKMENEDESLANLSIYNMDIMSAELLENTETRCSERRKAGVSRHTHRSRPNSGKSKLHFKANQLAEPQTRDIGKPPTPTVDMHLSGVATCQPFYYYDDSPPVRECRNMSSRGVSRSTCYPDQPYGIQSHDLPRHHNSPVPSEQSFIHGDVLTNNESAVLHDMNQSQPTTKLTNQSYHSRNLTSDSPDHVIRDVITPKHMLSLALPDAYDSADEEEEIPTLRLLDDLHIDLAAGKVTATEELKAHLADVMISPAKVSEVQNALSEDEQIENHLSARSSTIKSDSKTPDWKKVELETELTDLLSRRPQRNISDARGIKKSVDCWTIPRKDSVDSVTTSDINYGNQVLAEVTSNSQVLAGVRGDSQVLDEVTGDSQIFNGLAGGGQVVAEVICDSQVDTKVAGDSQVVAEETSNSQVAAEVTGDSQAISGVSSYDMMNNAVMSTEETNRKQEMATTDSVEELLYRWNINIDTSKQMGDIQVPLVNTRKDYDAMNNEIDENVEQLEMELALQIAESQQTIARLQAEVDATEFTIPAFCELQGSSTSPAQPQKLWQTVKGRNFKKAIKAPTAGKVNVSKVGSRVDSGVRRKSPGKPKSKRENADEKHFSEQLCVNAVGSDQSRNGKSDGMCHGTSGAPRQLSSKAARHVSFQEPVDINRKRTALPKKTITTLTFAEGKLFIALLILFVY